MAVTSRTYTGDGIMDTFNFPFSYIDEDDVSVTIDGVTQTTPTNYSFATASSILFVTPPGVDTEVKIFRATDIDTKKATFATGAALRASDLNLNFDQVLYAGQELENGLIEAFLPDDSVQTSMIQDGAVTNTKLAADAVTTDKILDGTIVNADINASAAIATSKLAAGPLDTNVTVASANIVDGTIVDADINASAEIAVSKLADGTARQLLQTDAGGTGVEWTSNVDVPGTLDVTGVATFDDQVVCDSTGALTVPDGTTAQRPGAPATGMIRYNSTDSEYEGYNGSSWVSLSTVPDFSDGTAAAPSITFTSDTNTGLFRPGDNRLGFATAGAEAMRIDPSGNVGIRTTTPSEPLEVARLINVAPNAWESPTMPATATIVATPGNNNAGSGSAVCIMSGNTASSTVYFGDSDDGDVGYIEYDHTGDTMRFRSNAAERTRIDASGNFLVGKTAADSTVVGCEARNNGRLFSTVDGDLCLIVNRLTDDGTLVQFRQDSSQEGAISVSGTTVTYGGGHLARWSRFPDESKPEIYKGSVLHNLDEMVVWEGEDNEQLNKTELCSEYKCKRVAGLFDHWDTEDDLNDFYIAECGDFIVRVAPGVTVENGDLLTSSDVEGCAVPQDDDIVHSYTIAKVTSITHAFDYPDGSYAVPCTITQ